ncbi:helix-turn-helix transcriptional regulator [Aureimonas psammosilenae]|uniref:helix-turn-helix transcriptional regulator n=1 Tax=Aureimonas psammosilenae TaxID=2495496 RepID=UPI001AEED0AC|nr:AraC family transcriptional regulator [Aureimonas psammosilenae]
MFRTERPAVLLWVGTMARTDTTSPLHIRLSSAEGSPAWRIERWRDAMSPSGKVEVDPANAATFEADFRSRVLGDVRMLRVEASTFRFTRNATMAGEIRRDHLLVNLVERGVLSGQLGPRKVAVEPGAVSISRLADTMDVTLHEATWLGFVVPLDLVEREMPWPRGLDGRVFPQGSVQATMLGHQLSALQALPDRIAAREGAELAQISLHFVLSCLTGRVLARAGAGQKSDRIEDPAIPIRRFIARHLVDPDLGPARICREFGLSRSRLYRIMGDSADIAATVRRLRLKGARRDIASNLFAHLSIAEIAKRWGMPDERSFRRAFSREFGYAPSASRAAAEPAAAGQGDVPPLIGADLERWFDGLS